jgi:thiol-disulfide isomerase/thioredoxin
MWMVRRTLVAAGIALLLALLVTAGLHNLRTRREAMQEAAAQHVDLTPVVTGKAADNAIPSELGKDLRGQMAPDFSLTTLDGRKVKLSDLRGKTVMVNFWATYCGPCRLEMPWFDEFGKKYAGDQLVVLGLDDEEGVTKDDVAKAAKRAGVTYPILMADDKTEKAYGLGDYLPVTFYIDAKGTVVAQTPGAPTKDEVEALIQKTLAASKS